MKIKNDATFGIYFGSINNFILKHIFEFFTEIVPSLEKARHHFGKKQKLEKVLQNKIRELKTKLLRIESAKAAAKRMCALQLVNCLDGGGHGQI